MINFPDANTVLHCPKCGAITAEVASTQYHSHLLQAEPEIPCGELVFTFDSEDLEGIDEHLCRKCRRCGFGWIEAVMLTGSLYEGPDQIEETG